MPVPEPETVTVEWETTQVTTYRMTFALEDWRAIADTAYDDLSEFEEPENEIHFSNERIVTLPTDL